MKIEIIRENDVVTSIWAGGESRQYFIYPHTANYADRNFCFRLSMAASYSHVEAKYSNLENFTRYLIMLEGEAHVFHKDHYDIVMEPYRDIDVFDGGWESSAAGKVIDFNMMLNENCTGKMSVVDKDCIIKSELCKECNKPYKWTAFFCGSGHAFFEVSTGEKAEVSKGGLILFEEVPDDVNIKVTLYDSKLVRMDICFMEDL